MSTYNQLLYAVARHYYIDNMSQVEISERLSLSRSKVSRLLVKAREEGIVNIQINAPVGNYMRELEEQIKERFGIEHVLVVATMYDNPVRNLQHTLSQASPFFQSLLSDGDSIGVAWGLTLAKLIESMDSLNLANSTLLQIAGNLDNGDANSYATEIISHFSQKLGIKNVFSLPCPVLVENSIIVDLLFHDSKISNVISQINSVDVAFPNIGVLSEDNCLWSTGYISTNDLHRLRKSGSVGCVCSHFIDSNGNIVDSSLDERTIAISMDALRKARYSCACVCNEAKIPPLLGCLRAGLVNVLAIDSQTAVQLLASAGQSE